MSNVLEIALIFLHHQKANAYICGKAWVPRSGWCKTACELHLCSHMESYKIALGRISLPESISEITFSFFLLNDHSIPLRILCSTQTFLNITNATPGSMVQGSSPSSGHFIIALTSLQLKLIIIKSLYPPIFNSNLGVDTHQIGKRASAADAR